MIQGLWGIYCLSPSLEALQQADIQDAQFGLLQGAADIQCIG